MLTLGLAPTSRCLAVDTDLSGGLVVFVFFVSCDGSRLRELERCIGGCLAADDMARRGGVSGLGLVVVLGVGTVVAFDDEFGLSGNGVWLVLGFLVFAGLGRREAPGRDGSLELDAVELEVRDDFAFREDRLVESVPELDERIMMVLGSEERLTLFDIELVDTAERVTELLLAIFVVPVELLVS